jgi:hypothetical protein
VKELYIFLGLAGYYRKCVKHFSIISQPLTNLLKNTMFIWTPGHELTFVILKKASVPAPVLALANFAKPFIIETGASDADIGSNFDAVRSPISFSQQSIESQSYSSIHL